MHEHNQPPAFWAGVASGTFRSKTADVVAALAVAAGLEAVEWAGDVHARPRRLAEAARLRQLSARGRLGVSYGSYYRVGESEREGLAFSDVLAVARELRAPLIRVWAGRRGSREANEAYWRRVCDDAHRVAGLAAAAGIGVAFERHTDTLTDSVDSHLRLLEAVPLPHVYTYWQPDVRCDLASNVDCLRRVLPRLAVRLPLVQGEDEWFHYLEVLGESPTMGALLLEFVVGDSVEAFHRDASCLRGWVKTLNGERPTRT